MKIKCTSLFLSFLILVSNMGLAFNVHYCGGQIAKISSVYSSDVSDVQKIPTKKGCCAAKAKEGKSCCKDKVVQVKEKSDVVVKSFSFHVDAPFVPDFWKPIVFSQVPVLQKQQITSYYCDANAPPLYKLYSQYTLYA